MLPADDIVWQKNQRLNCLEPSVPKALPRNVIWTRGPLRYGSLSGIRKRQG